MANATSASSTKLAVLVEVAWTSWPRSRGDCRQSSTLSDMHGRQAKMAIQDSQKIVVFDAKEKMGILYTENTVTGVRAGEQADQRGVCMGWRVLEVNGTAMPSGKGAELAIHAHLSEIKRQAHMRIAIKFEVPNNLSRADWHDFLGPAAPSSDPSEASTSPNICRDGASCNRHGCHFTDPSEDVLCGVSPQEVWEDHDFLRSTRATQALACSPNNAAAERFSLETSVQDELAKIKTEQLNRREYTDILEKQKLRRELAHCKEALINAEAARENFAEMHDKVRNPVPHRNECQLLHVVD